VKLIPVLHECTAIFGAAKRGVDRVTVHISRCTRRNNGHCDNRHAYFRHFLRGSVFTAVCVLSVRLYAERLKKLWAYFHEIWGVGRLWIREELIKFRKVRVRVSELWRGCALHRVPSSAL